MSVYVIVDQPSKVYAVQLFIYLRLRFFVYNFSDFRLNKMYITLCCTIAVAGSAKMMRYSEERPWKTRRECADRINKSYARKRCLFSCCLLWHGSVFG